MRATFLNPLRPQVLSSDTRWFVTLELGDGGFRWPFDAIAGVSVKVHTIPATELVSMHRRRGRFCRPRFDLIATVSSATKGGAHVVVDG